MGRIATFFFWAMLLNVGKAAAQLHLRPQKDSLPQLVRIRVLPQNFYNQGLSFFCRKELQVQRLTSVPLFFRLGSKEYVDYLEKKPNTHWRPQ